MESEVSAEDESERDFIEVDVASLLTSDPGRRSLSARPRPLEGAGVQLRPWDCGEGFFSFLNGSSIRAGPAGLEGMWHEGVPLASLGTGPPPLGTGTPTPPSMDWIFLS